MKVAITTAVLLVLLGTTASSYARQEKGQEEHSQGAKPAEQQHPQQQSKPAQQQHTQEQSKPVQQQHVKQQAKPAQQQHAQEQTKPAQQQHVKQQAKPAQQQHAHNRTATRESKPAQQQHVKQQAKPVQQQHAQQGNAGQSQAQAQQSHPAGGNKGNYAHGRISDAITPPALVAGTDSTLAKATISIGASSMVATRSGLSIPGRSVGATRTTFTSCTSMVVITCTTRFIPGLRIAISIF
jgi:hypothetical protein